jgi:hypothetical protein
MRHTSNILMAAQRARQMDTLTLQGNFPLKRKTPSFENIGYSDNG